MNWELRGDTALFDVLGPAWRDAAEQNASLRGRLELADGPVFQKASPLSARAGGRHARRRWLLGIEPPRLAEFSNLEWLRQRGFGAPEPRFAACLVRPRLAFQGLVTRWIDGARAFETADLDELARLGAEVGRLHALGFVHRDLFARNLLLAPDGGWVFLDAWRGGPRRGLRGPLWDLACLCTDPPQPLEDQRIQAVLAGYLDAGGEVRTQRFERECAAVARRYADRI
ncbi:MAG: lipopolysaccharide kinase InaA family protein [Planctomycetota bacterium]